ncbi:hypothetical protein JTB14_026526 [Gonioctena quinquepunctata]|nr:hypothetical protein JTB14_026526 [Gonioctena quinquepunctata]
MKNGDSDVASHGEISFIKWKDRGQKSVILLSTFHDHSRRVEIIRTNNTGEKEPLLCPPPVKDYDGNMVVWTSSTSTFHVIISVGRAEDGRSISYLDSPTVINQHAIPFPTGIPPGGHTPKNNGVVDLENMRNNSY